MVTLDLIQHRQGRHWSEARLVAVGRWSGAFALLIGAVLAPIVMRWENIFRYAQDVWAPMAAPVVVVFLAGALWKRATERGALMCLWLAVLSVPFTLLKGILADWGIHFLPSNLENPMVFAGAYALVSLVFMIVLSCAMPGGWALLTTSVSAAVILLAAAISPSAIALVLLLTTIIAVSSLMIFRREPQPDLWDRSMLVAGKTQGWYRSLWLWWALLATCLVAIYIKFW